MATNELMYLIRSRWCEPYNNKSGNFPFIQESLARKRANEYGKMSKCMFCVAQAYNTKDISMCVPGYFYHHHRCCHQNCLWMMVRVLYVRISLLLLYSIYLANVFACTLWMCHGEPLKIRLMHNYINPLNGKVLGSPILSFTFTLFHSTHFYGI